MAPQMKGLGGSKAMLLVSVCVAAQRGEKEKYRGERIKQCRTVIKAYQNGGWWRGIRAKVARPPAFDTEVIFTVIVIDRKVNVHLWQRAGDISVLTMWDDGKAEVQSQHEF